MESTSPWAVICELLGHIGHGHQATKDKGGKFLVPEIEFYTIKVLKGGGPFKILILKVRIHDIKIL